MVVPNVVPNAGATRLQLRQRQSPTRMMDTPNEPKPQHSCVRFTAHDDHDLTNWTFLWLLYGLILHLHTTQQAAF
jgi:hypothetical protein